MYKIVSHNVYSFNQIISTIKYSRRQIKLAVSQVEVWVYLAPTLHFITDLRIYWIVVWTCYRFCFVTDKILQSHKVSRLLTKKDIIKLQVSEWPLKNIVNLLNTSTCHFCIFLSLLREVGDTTSCSILEVRCFCGMACQQQRGRRSCSQFKKVSPQTIYTIAFVDEPSPCPCFIFSCYIIV